MTETGTEHRILDDLKRSWMARGAYPSILISAAQKINISELRAALMGLVKQIHFIRYPNTRPPEDWVEFQDGEQEV